MRKVITSVALYLMTLLMGCSFSKDKDQSTTNSKETNQVSLKELVQVNDTESAIKHLPEEGIRDYFKDIPSKELNTPFTNGKTPIQVALERGNINVLKDLLSLGASPYVPNSKTGMSPLENPPSENTKDARTAMAKDSVGTLIGNYLFLQKRKASTFLLNKNYSEYLSNFYEKHLPCDVLLEDLIRGKRDRSSPGVPSEFLKKILAAPSCASKFNKERAPDLFLREFNNQAKVSFSNLAVLDFLSGKLEDKPAAVVLHKDDQKKIFTTPAALLIWSLKKKNSTAGIEMLERIHRLSKMPHDAVIVISSHQSKFPSKEDIFLLESEILRTQDKEILTLLAEQEEKNLLIIEGLIQKAATP
ncbi:MAG: ankyrin repeat domain-containing protein [Bdellovibrio sp.]|nr:ankyrin repeat domain-containing protein [Bdellovibrio sp.]